MFSILAWLVKIFNLLTLVYQQNGQILTDQHQTQVDIAIVLTQNTQLLAAVGEMQDDLDVIKKVLGVGVPVQETIIFGPPKP